MRFDLHRSKLGLPACDSKEEAHLLTISIQPGGEPHGIGHNLANKSRYNRIKGSLTGGHLQSTGLFAQQVPVPDFGKA